LKKFIKWFVLAVIVIGAVGFVAFLYLMPPFTLLAPETLSAPLIDAGPPLSAIADPGERATAQRGRYLVTIGACDGCHATPGPEGPDVKNMYLAGGFYMARKGVGTYVSMNLTPDSETGLGKWTDDDIKRVLRNGIAPDGRQIPGHLMPWPGFSNWTEEDRHAVVAYLRRIKPISHRIPAPRSDTTFADPAAYEVDYGGKDYAVEKR
jgi:cytochrome c2